MAQDGNAQEASFGPRLAAARTAAGLSRSELADRLSVGPRTVRSWEDGRSEPSGVRLQVLAGLLNVSLRWLLTGGGAGSPNRPPEDDSVELAAMRAELRDLRALLRQALEGVSRLERRLTAARGPRQ